LTRLELEEVDDMGEEEACLKEEEEEEEEEEDEEEEEEEEEEDEVLDFADGVSEPVCFASVALLTRFSKVSEKIFSTL